MTGTDFQNISGEILNCVIHPSLTLNITEDKNLVWQLLINLWNVCINKKAKQVDIDS